MASVTSFPSPTASRNLLGPLTTIYTKPNALCSVYAQSLGNDYVWQAQGCSNGNVVDTSSCWPPALVSAPNPPYGPWGFYSPGVMCPRGYSSACTAAVNTDGSPAAITSGVSFSFNFPLLPGETATGCCPTGFACASSAQTCVSTMTSGSYEIGFCDQSASQLASLQFVTVPATNQISTGGTTYVSTVLTGVLVAPLFQLVNRPAITTTSSTATSTSTSTSTTTTTTSGAATPIPPPGLSTGAMAAIGTTVPIVVLTIAGILVWLCLRRRRRNRSPAYQPPLPMENKRDNEPQGSHMHSELEGTRQAPELDSKTQPQELGTKDGKSRRSGYQTVPQELDASGS